MRSLKMGQVQIDARVRPPSHRSLLGLFALFVLSVPPPTQQSDEDVFATMCIIGLVGAVLLWIWPAIWMYRDAKRRRKEAGLWLLIGILAPIIGPLIWFIIRNDPEERRAPMYYGYPPPQYYPPSQYYPPPQYQQQQYSAYDQHYYDTVEVVEVDVEQGYNQTRYDPYQRR